MSGSQWDGTEQVLKLLKELRRRKVWLFGGIYLALGWILLQVSIAIELTLGLPDWIDQSVLVLLIIGFPVALLLAWAQESEAADTGAVADDAVEPAEGRPSFSAAVLPFDDLSRDGSFQDIADGISEDIITPLSFLDPLRVTARNSSFAFKGTSPDIRDVGRKLNVRYVLEGSIRQIGENARITAQLIDALTGEHVWSDKFDCPIESMDEEIDEVVLEIVGQTGNGVAVQEMSRLTAEDLSDLSVSDMKTVAFFHLGDINPANLEAADKYAQMALEKAPDDAYAHALMARTQAAKPLWGSGSRSGNWGLAAGHLEKVKTAGTPDMPTLFSMAMAEYYMGKLGNLGTYAEQMRNFSSRHPGSIGLTSLSLLCAGKFEEYLATADPGNGFWSVRSPFYLMFLLYDTTAYLGLRNFARAEAYAGKYLSLRDNAEVRGLFVVALAHQGKIDEAGAELDALKASWPEELTLETAEQRFRLFTECDAMIDIQLEGLRLAGLE